MFDTSEGIIIKKIPYTGNGIILKVLTENHGVQTYFTRKTKKDKGNYLPLSIVFITAAFNPKKSMHNCKEITYSYNYKTIQSNLLKANIILFLNEILDHLIQEEDIDSTIYDFIKLSLIGFDKEEENLNFHLIFLIQLSKLMGLSPETEMSNGYYDLMESKIKYTQPNHPNYFNEYETKLFQNVVKYALNADTILEINNPKRRIIIQLIVKYFQYHTDMRPIKSLAVLEMVFD